MLLLLLCDTVMRGGPGPREYLMQICQVFGAANDLYSPALETSQSLIKL